MLKRKRAPANSEAAFGDVCHRLEEAIVGEKSSASFACGGAIPIVNTLAANDRMERAYVSSSKPVKPINIFWETKKMNARPESSFFHATLLSIVRVVLKYAI